MSYFLNAIFLFNMLNQIYFRIP